MNGLERPTQTQTHLHVDLDCERDALLQLLRFFIEVLAELSNGDSSLDGKRENKHGKNEAWISLKCMRSLSSQTFQLKVTRVTLCCQNTDAWAAVSQSITELQRGLTIFAHMNGLGNGRLMGC